MNHSLTLRPAFTPLTIILMVIGFMLFWPLGLAMLVYILWGDRLHAMGSRISGAGEGWSREFRGCGRMGFSSGNLAFDEYRERELKRIEQERRRLDQERREFDSFVRNLRRAKDQEEFDRFMSDRQASRRSEATDL